VTFALWSAGVPVVAGALYFETAALLCAGAWLLLAAVVLSALNTAIVARHAFRRPTGSIERSGAGGS